LYYFYFYFNSWAWNHWIHKNEKYPRDNHIGRHLEWDNFWRSSTTVQYHGISSLLPFQALTKICFPLLGTPRHHYVISTFFFFFTKEYNIVNIAQSLCTALQKKNVGSWCFVRLFLRLTRFCNIIYIIIQCRNGEKLYGIVNYCFWLVEICLYKTVHDYYLIQYLDFFRVSSFLKVWLCLFCTVRVVPCT